MRCTHLEIGEEREDGTPSFWSVPMMKTVGADIVLLPYTRNVANRQHQASPMLQCFADECRVRDGTIDVKTDA